MAAAPTTAFAAAPTTAPTTAFAAAPTTAFAAAPTTAPTTAFAAAPTTAPTTTTQFDRIMTLACYVYGADSRRPTDPLSAHTALIRYYISRRETPEPPIIRALLAFISTITGAVDEDILERELLELNSVISFFATKAPDPLRFLGQVIPLGIFNITCRIRREYPESKFAALAVSACRLIARKPDAEPRKPNPFRITNPFC